MNASVQLSSSEHRVLEALDRWFQFQAESDEKPLNECGWSDFDGISFAGGMPELAAMATAGLLESREHPIFMDTVQYRISQAGWKALEGAQS